MSHGLIFKNLDLKLKKKFKITCTKQKQLKTKYLIIFLRKVIKVFGILKNNKKLKYKFNFCLFFGLTIKEINRKNRLNKNSLHVR